MWVTQIYISNYMGIKTFKVDALGKINIITGKNGSGKSSVYRAICDGLKSRGVDPSAIHLLEEEAEIKIWLDGETEIRRRLTQTDNTAKVVVRGTPVSSPGGWLTKILGPFNLDPTALYLADKRTRREMVLKAIDFRLTQVDIEQALEAARLGADLRRLINLRGFDYSVHGLVLLQAIQDKVYDTRREVNLDKTRIQKAIEQDRLEIPPTFNRQEVAKVDLQELFDRQTEMHKQEEDHKRDERAVLELSNACAERERSIVKWREGIKQLQGWIKDSEKRLEEDTLRRVEAEERFNKYIAPDLEPIRKAITDYKRNQELLLKLESIESREADLKSAEVMHADLDALHKALVNTVPKTLMTKLKLPIEGLTIEGDLIKINGVNLEKLSTSEQVKFAVSLARALAGEFKGVLIDRFEALDSEARMAFFEECKGDAFQYFLIRVTDGPLELTVSEPSDAANLPGIPGREEATPDQKKNH